MRTPVTHPFHRGASVRLLGQHERGAAVVQWTSNVSQLLLIEFADGTHELVEPHHLVNNWESVRDALEGRR